MTIIDLSLYTSNHSTHYQYFQSAAEQAIMATCTRARCGSVIVDTTGQIIGVGYNAPPLGNESNRKCAGSYDITSKPKSDKTCCIHAEWNAILNGLAAHPDLMSGATLYFMRVDEQGQFTQAGEPYCTVCSRLALQSGIAYFGLWNDGPQIIPTDVYNDASYAYHQQEC